MMISTRPWLALAALVFLPLVRNKEPLQAKSPRIDDTIELEDPIGSWGEPGHGGWRITVTGSGLDPAAGDLRVSLDDWGGWAEADSLYFQLVEARPRTSRGEGAGVRYTLGGPEWTGDFSFTYRLQPTLRGSGTHARFGLLPFQDERYAFGNSNNVFVDLEQDAGTVIGQRSLTLIARPDVDVSTSWSGPAAPGMKLDVDPAADNALLAFGTPAASLGIGGAAGAQDVDVAQFGAGKDVTKTVGGMVAWLEAWVRARGLADFWEQSIAGTDTYDPAELLERIGFDGLDEAEQDALDAFFEPS